MRFLSSIIIFLTLAFNGECFSNPPPYIGFLINSGERVTNSREVMVRIRTLKTSPTLLESMQIGKKEDLSDAQWQPFSSDPVKIMLDEGDGEKFVYARLKDKAGNISPIEAASIVLDTTPPKEMDFAINGDSKYFSDKTGRVTLQLKGDDAAAWQVSNTSDFNGAKWEPLNNNRSWTLDLRGGDGEKTVFVRFKDQAGNISETLSKSIIYDTEAPKNVQIIINDGEKFTKTTKAKLKIKAEGAYLMRVADRSSAENFDFVAGKDGFMTIDWNFDTLQGKKVVRAYFMDEAGNKTTTPAEAEIIYDTRGPAAPRLVIDNGNKYTNSADGKVDLQVFLRENEPGLKMTLSNDGGFGDAITKDYSQSVKGFGISTDKDGLKTIYLRLTDEAGNISATVSSSIVLDRKAPLIKSFTINEGSEFAIAPQVSLQIVADDAAAMQISNNTNFTAGMKWEQFRPFINDWRLSPGDGQKDIFARFRDEAGNVSEITSATIFLDTEPPVGKFNINDGSKYTNDPAGNVRIHIEYDGNDVMGMQISNSPDFTNVKLRPLAPDVEWQLNPGEGMKTVFVRLKDKAGNFSTVYASNIIVDKQAPENCEVRINNGEEWVTNPSNKVALSLVATNAYKMKVSNDRNFDKVEWMPYKTAISWTLGDGEGAHSVYAIFADQADNISETVTANIKSDFTAPVVKSFKTEGEKSFCNDPQKKITLLIDVEGASSMAIDNIPITENASWEPVKNTREWILSNEDGVKTVYARFKDLAGNVTAEQNLKIILDRVPPVENEIAINKNEEWLTQKDGRVTLFIKSNGAAKMMISNEPDFKNAKWETITAIKEEWPININATEATVYAKFRDLAGNVSETVSDNIKIDNVPPSNAKIIINKGDKYLSSTDRKLSVDISVEGASYMRLSLSKIFSDTEWEPLAASKELVALDGDGVKTVYAQFKDQANNTSEVVSDDIIIDTTPPKLISFQIDNGAEWTNNTEKKVLLDIKATEANEMKIDSDPTFPNTSWKKYSDTVKDFVLPGTDGEKTLYLILKDEAGNTSETYSAKINLKRSF